MSADGQTLLGREVTDCSKGQARVVSPSTAICVCAAREMGTMGACAELQVGSRRRLTQLVNSMKLSKMY